MKIVIHPGERALSPFIENVPASFAAGEDYIYKGRNEIKLARAGERELAVKSYKVPHLVNRVAYTFPRASKARRAYRNALELVARGVPTPSPVAYIEEKRGGLLSRSFYISSYERYPGMLRELHGQPLEEVKELAAAFARFTADVHRRRVLHLDYSPGNIIYEKRDDSYHFCLVDVNRMRIGTCVNERAAAFNLRKLWGKTETVLFIAGVYARERGFDEKRFKERVARYRRDFWNGFTRKHPDKKYLVEA
jgi:aminoglycoside phosphotransferase (APT) family kinase protein